MSAFDPDLELEPYQTECLDWLAGVSRRCLAGDPGIGKTPIGVAVCDKLNAQRVLVLCPAIALEVWRRHFLAWSNRGLPIVIVRGASDLRPGAGVFVVSYALASLRKESPPRARAGGNCPLMTVAACLLEGALVESFESWALGTIRRGNGMGGA